MAGCGPVDVQSPHYMAPAIQFAGETGSGSADGGKPCAIVPGFCACCIDIACQLIGPRKRIGRITAYFLQLLNARDGYAGSPGRCRQGYSQQEHAQSGDEKKYSAVMMEHVSLCLEISRVFLRGFVLHRGL